MYLSSFLVLVVFTFLNNGNFVKSSDNSKLVEENLGKCPRSHPEFNKCLMDFFNEVQPALSEGIPEWDVQRSDPLFIPLLVIERIEGLNLKETIINLTVTGLKDAKVVRADFTKLPTSMEMTWEMPYMTVDHEYNMEGNILGVPIRGKGHASANITMMRNKMKIKTELIKKNDEDYLQISDVKYVLESPKQFSVHFTNDLNKDKKINEAMNKFFNDNWKYIFEMMKHHRTGTLESIIKDEINKIWIRFPYMKLFPLE